MTDRPCIAITLGDVAGIGPEIVAQVVERSPSADRFSPLVVGHPEVLRRALQLTGSAACVREIASPLSDWNPVTSPGEVLCWNPGNAAAADVEPGVVDPRAGRAAFDALVGAIDLALSRRVEAIVTAPLNKAALHAAGLDYPGHTEILAERCGVSDFAMMLYLPAGAAVRGTHGLGVAHVTLHTSIRSVPDLLSATAIEEKIGLTHRFLRSIGCAQPRVGVCALNPHAGESGLFGDEESRLIAPAVERACASGIDARGPIPADALLRRAAAGEFDGVVAMYHDQGHIALKLLGYDRAVNVTLGLPIIRTSPSHGTAYDIAWQGRANADGMQAALDLARELAARRQVV